MKILAKGNSKRLEELKQKLSLPDYEIDCVDENTHFILKDGMYDAIFDLNFDDEGQSSFFDYKDLVLTPLFVGAVKNSLAAMVHKAAHPITSPLFGINSMETFLHRSLLEISVFNNVHSSVLQEVMAQLNWDFKVVNDRVGMVTPRVVCMIINEACYTLQEGTANMQDIDISMKLGTNYPFGPFEWGDKIGIQHVYEILLAMYTDTNDERYKICPLLKTKYLRNETFFNNSALN